MLLALELLHHHEQQSIMVMGPHERDLVRGPHRAEHHGGSGGCTHNLPTARFLPVHASSSSSTTSKRRDGGDVRYPDEDRHPGVSCVRVYYYCRCYFYWPSM